MARKKLKLLYRYEASPVGEGIWSQINLVLFVYHVVRLTPEGYWIQYGERAQSNYFGKAQFVNTTATKQYAWPTPDLALKSYIARKRRQITILTHQLAQAERSLEVAKTFKPERPRSKR